MYCNSKVKEWNIRLRSQLQLLPKNLNDLIIISYFARGVSGPGENQNLPNFEFGALFILRDFALRAIRNDVKACHWFNFARRIYGFMVRPSWLASTISFMTTYGLIYNHNKLKSFLMDFLQSQ